MPPGDRRLSCRVALTLAGQTHEITVEPGETIFAAAHRAGVAPPFSCLAGHCGECTALLEDGRVAMRVNRSLTPKQLARGLILICQARPETPRCRVRIVGP